MAQKIPRSDILEHTHHSSGTVPEFHPERLYEVDGQARDSLFRQIVLHHFKFRINKVNTSDISQTAPNVSPVIPLIFLIIYFVKIKEKKEVI